MVQIKLTESDLSFLETYYPSLHYVDNDNFISGVIYIDLIYKGIRIKDSYDIEFQLVSKGNSILPTVRETQNRILNIANRKGISRNDLHLNNEQGELCLIIPPKEKERYPSGFQLQRFLKHIEEHMYWVSFYERYEKPPWKEQAHGINGYIELYHENFSYRGEIKKEFERLMGRPLKRPEIRRIVKNKKNYE